MQQLLKQVLDSIFLSSLKCFWRFYGIIVLYLCHRYSEVMECWIMGFNYALVGCSGPLIFLFRPGSGPKPQSLVFSGSYFLCWKALWCQIKKGHWSCGSSQGLLKSSRTSISTQILEHCTRYHSRKTYISASEIILFLHQPSHLFLHTRLHTSEDGKSMTLPQPSLPGGLMVLCCLMVAHRVWH